jgi:hypothetical protein
LIIIRVEVKICSDCKIEKDNKAFGKKCGICKLCTKTKSDNRKNLTCRECGLIGDADLFATRMFICKNCDKIKKKETYLFNKNNKENINKTCSKCHIEKPGTLFITNSNICHQCRKIWADTSYKNQYLFYNAKRRAKRDNLNFTLLIEDIVIPQRCPYINIKLDRNVKGYSDSSVTLDRINNNLGYIKENIIVISRKANVMKGDLTIEEIELINNNFYNSPSISDAVSYNVNNNLSDAKARAKRHNIEFNILKDDIILTKMCPILNIELYKSKLKLCSNSPSLDRIDNDKGYVPGNVRVISYKANRSKNNATKEEYNLLATNLRKLIETRFTK